jgi:hypothetical protein
MKEGETGRICTTLGTRKRIAFWCESEMQRPLGRPRRRWENSITMELRGIGWGGIDWVDLALGRANRRLL